MEGCSRSRRWWRPRSAWCRSSRSRSCSRHCWAGPCTAQGFGWDRRGERGLSAPDGTPGTRQGARRSGSPSSSTVCSGLARGPAKASAAAAAAAPPCSYPSGK
eukprot:3794423-Prymnesium_polylepis.1